MPNIKSEKVTEVLNEVTHLKDKQEDMDSKLDTMKKENEALWREVVNLRQKHMSQQKIVNKLIQFLVSIVRPASLGRGQAVKRRYTPQLAIEATGAKSARYVLPLVENLFRSNMPYHATLTGTVLRRQQQAA